MGQAYYIIEHIAWARDKKILTGSSKNLWTIGIFCWLTSLCVSVTQSLWHLRNLANEMASSKDDSNAVHCRKQWYYARQRQLIVTVVGSLADGCNAVNWLPKGILWSGHFSKGVIGLMGSISSAALMYNYLNPLPQKELEEKKDTWMVCDCYTLILYINGLIVPWLQDHIIQYQQFFY